MTISKFQRGQVMSGVSLRGCTYITSRSGSLKVQYTKQCGNYRIRRLVLSIPALQLYHRESYISFFIYFLKWNENKIPSYLKRHFNFLSKMFVLLMFVFTSTKVTVCKRQMFKKARKERNEKIFIFSLWVNLFKKN